MCKVALRFPAAMKLPPRRTHEILFLSVPNNRDPKSRSFKGRSMTSTSCQKSLQRHRISTLTVVEDDNDPVKRENVLMAEAAATTEPGSGVSDDFGKAVMTSALEKYC